jgi:hypothetical protein
MTDLTTEQIVVTLARLRRMRHARAMTAPRPAAGESLVPLLNASAECTALDVAIRVFESKLREVVA